MSGSKIRDLPLLHRPREKALYYGIGSLTEVELLALIIEQGTKSENALSLAENLLSRHINLSNLYRLHSPELLMMKGIGKAKALKILAMFELNKRLVYFENNEVSSYQEARVVANYQHKIGRLSKETLYLLALNKRKMIIFEKQLYVGDEQGFNIDSKEIIRELLLVNAVYFILIHNHPSGGVEPSHYDLETTKKLATLSSKFGLTLYDHLIISADNYCSLRSYNSEK